MDAHTPPAPYSHTEPRLMIPDRKVLISSDVLNRRIASVGTSLGEQVAGMKNPVVVVCVLKGAVRFMTALTHWFPPNYRVDYVKTAGYTEGKENVGGIKMLYDGIEDVDGAHVMVVDDIGDRRLTFEFLNQRLFERGARVVENVAMLNKPERKEVDTPLHHVCFDIIGVPFVWGFGLDGKDKAQRTRNDPEICYYDDHKGAADYFIPNDFPR